MPFAYSTMVFHRILDFKTELDFYPGSFFIFAIIIEAFQKSEPFKPQTFIKFMLPTRSLYQRSESKFM